MGVKFSCFYGILIVVVWGTDVPHRLIFEHLVPSWRHCLGEARELLGRGGSASPASGSPLAAHSLSCSLYVPCWTFPTMLDLPYTGTEAFWKGTSLGCRQRGSHLSRNLKGLLRAGITVWIWNVPYSVMCWTLGPQMGILPEELVEL